jgi:4-hydroxy-2-oxoheptanedioate aldolase
MLTTASSVRSHAASAERHGRALAGRYLEAGAKFILVGADVTLLAAGSEQLAARHRPPQD